MELSIAPDGYFCSGNSNESDENFFALHLLNSETIEIK